MSDKERYGNRDLTYSTWHRVESTRRFLDDFSAWRLGMVDIDDCEYCRFCYAPLALIELAQDIGQQDKPMMVTCNLAQRAGLPAYLVFYTVCGKDISQFRVMQLEPTNGPERILSPAEYAQFLFAFHESHDRDCPKRKGKNG